MASYIDEIKFEPYDFDEPEAPVYKEDTNNLLISFMGFADDGTLTLDFEIFKSQENKIDDMCDVVAGMFKYTNYTNQFLNYNYKQRGVTDKFVMLKKVVFTYHGKTIVAESTNRISMKKQAGVFR